MSTTLTLDEAKRLYPKFYQSPHLWTDAIEVEVNEDFEMDGLEFMVMNSYDLSRFFLTDLLEKNKLDYFIPLFKPQEGEQFIKDLEAAVQVATDGAVKVRTTDSHIYFITKDRLHSLKIRTCNFMLVNCDMLFDTAAYADHLRKQGYYL